MQYAKNYSRRGKSTELNYCEQCGAGHAINCNLQVHLLAAKRLELTVLHIPCIKSPKEVEKESEGKVSKEE
jgi:hypothetical protein